MLGVIVIRYAVFIDTTRSTIFVWRTLDFSCVRIERTSLLGYAGISYKHSVKRLQCLWVKLVFLAIGNSE